MRKDFLLKTVNNNHLRISAYGLQNLSKCPCLILVHGFKGFKDWGFGPHTAEYFAENNYFVLTFNFSHNGVGDSLTEFTELDKFAENTFTLELSELSELIYAYKSGFFGADPNGTIGLIGHSRGGGISILAAAKNPVVNAVAVWSSVSTFDRYTERQKEKWKREGEFGVINTRTKQVMKLNSSLLDDLENNKNDKLNIQKAIMNLNRPLLIVHGEQDVAVPFNEATLLYHWSDKSSSELFGVPATGHTFGIQHPFDGSNEKFDSVLNKTLKFFNKYLY